MSKRTRSMALLLAALSAVVICTLFDLKLSILLYTPRSLFGLFFDAFGAWPAPFFGLLASAVLVAARPKTGAASRLFPFLFGALAILGGTLTIYVPCHYAFRIPFSPVFLLPGTLLALLSILLFSRLHPDIHRNARIIACAVLVLITSELLAINGLKLLWGRTRFRNMSFPYDAFAPWYRIDPSGGGVSFPSGHTGNAAVSFSLLYLRHLRPKQKYLPMLWAIPAVWTGLTAISRVILGYHFATDVLFACFITGGLAALFDYLFFTRKRGRGAPFRAG